MFPSRFDHEADRFDDRAGLSAAMAKQVAATLVHLATPAPGDLVVELGAGTGEIGEHLLGRGLRYLGSDLSYPMLRVFHARLAADQCRPLVRTDADRPWPLRDDSVKLLFLARAAHLLAADHLVAETLRVARDGACCVLGRVRREEGSVRQALRGELHRLLAVHGLQARRGDAAGQRLIAAFAAQGGEPLPPRTAATWTVAERPADALAAWRGKPGLAGTIIPGETQQQILDQLAAWAAARYGDLDAARPATETYELRAVRLPPVTTQTVPSKE